MEKVELFYVVAMGEDGSLLTYTEIPEGGFEATRKATVGDIMDTSRQLVKEIETQDLVSRIVTAINPSAPSVTERMMEALKARGIDPESVKITN